MTDAGFSTRAIHAGQDPDPASGAVIVPITLSSTFAQQSVGVHAGYEYSRSGNPTRHALETCLASLEQAVGGVCFSSGLAASDAVMRLAPAGSRILIGTDAYGGTHRLLTRVHNDRGIRTTAVPYTDPVALEAAFSDGDVAMVWIETPSNPMLTVVDIAAVAAIAHHHGAIVVVDNTFATPYLQQPLTCGADIVVHSSTKYLGGHSDVVGGFAATNDPGLHQQLLFLQNAAGAVPAPFDCYLILRGVKTLALRMEAHCANARAVAQWLETHPRIDQVMYPGLSSHPTFATATRQMRHAGGMVSCTLRGGESAARQFVESTRLFCLAESLGAVESLIEHPHSMTHASVVGTGLEVPTNLVRLSVGVEDVADLLADLDQALRA